MTKILGQFVAALIGLVVIVMSAVTAQRTGNQIVLLIGVWFAGWLTGFLSRVLWQADDWMMGA